MTATGTISRGVAELLSRLDGVIAKPNGGYRARCPAHGDEHQSLDIDIAGDGKPLILCRVCGKPGTAAILSAVNMTWPDVLATGDQMQPPTTSRPVLTGTRSQIVSTYDYKDEDGALLFQAVRFEPKDFRQRCPDGNGGWTWKLNGTRRVLYRLSELRESDPEQPVFIVEGEKDVDRLIHDGLVATTNPMGAGKWRPEYNEHLRGRHVVILPDNDQPGRQHAGDIARHLCDIAASVKIVELPGLREKGDVSDYLDAGHDKDDLLALVGNCANSAEFHRPATRAGPQSDDDSPTAHGGFCNAFTQEVESDDGESSKTICVGYSAQVLRDALKQLTGGWPKSANGMLFAEGLGHHPEWMRKAVETFAWIGGRLSESKENKLRWLKGADKVTEAQLHAYLAQTAERFDAVEELPHWPPLPGHYYMHPPLPQSDGTALRELCRRFSPATDVDSDLILAAILTPFAGIEPGQRPAFLIQGQDDDKHAGRGTGKTTFAELNARLCGGHIELRPTDDWDRFVTRLLSPAAITKRIVLLDNIKMLRFSWAELEAGITGAVISGRALYIGEGRRPNNLTYWITLNGANMSKDMAQRCVPIMLKRPMYDAAWEEGAIALIEEHRWEIIADIIAILKNPAPALKRFSRWSTWEKAVLSRVADPSECQKVIEERQTAIDDDQTEADLVRDGFRQELFRRGHNPDSEMIFIPSRTAAQIVNSIENEEKRPYGRAMVHLYTLTIPELRKSNRGMGRGCVWAGRDADPSRPAHGINDG